MLLRCWACGLAAHRASRCRSRSHEGSICGCFSCRASVRCGVGWSCLPARAEIFLLPLSPGRVWVQWVGLRVKFSSETTGPELSSWGGPQSLPPFPRQTRGCSGSLSSQPALAFQESARDSKVIGFEGVRLPVPSPCSTPWARQRRPPPDTGGVRRQSPPGSLTTQPSPPTTRAGPSHAPWNPNLSFSRPSPWALGGQSAVGAGRAAYSGKGSRPRPITLGQTRREGVLPHPHPSRLKPRAAPAAPAGTASRRRFQGREIPESNSVLGSPFSLLCPERTE